MFVFISVYGFFGGGRSFGRSKLKDCSEKKKRVNVFDAVDVCDFWDCVGMDD